MSENRTTTRSLYENSRREAIVILIIWLVTTIYSSVYCYLFGYKSHDMVASAKGPTLSELVGDLPGWNRAAESLQLPLSLGIPDWVFFGVVVPWCLCIGLTFWFCLFFFVEDDLSADGSDDHEDSVA